MRGYTVFRIHLMRPGTTAVTVAFGGTVADEATVRQRATNEGLLAGRDVPPNPVIVTRDASPPSRISACNWSSSNGCSRTLRPVSPFETRERILRSMAFN